jgi:predicted ATPase
MLIHAIKLRRFLSFGASTEAVELLPLNVVIGPNGSGKSNLLEAFDLLRNVPRDFREPIRAGGGLYEWLWKGQDVQRATFGAPVASVDVVVSNVGGRPNLRYQLGFSSVFGGGAIDVLQESIEDAQPEQGSDRCRSYYRHQIAKAELRVGGETRLLQPKDYDASQSILAQRRDPDQYPEITHLAQSYEQIRLYRDWSFGRQSPARRPQDAALPNQYLEPDGGNLGLILNRFQREPAVKARLLEALRKLYEGINDYGVQIEGGTVQVFVQEGDRTIPAARLSDGTLRYLCLLAILCHPKPPPLVCIEEPELGLHPDVLPTIADLLKEASERCQLIVTTHSDVLVDAMTDRPEDVLVAEKAENGTVLRRLAADNLKPWLTKYRLGELWIRGDIGGTRW